MKEIIIYGLPCGESRDYMEDILANFPATDKANANIERVKAAAAAQGWHSFRITYYNGEAPDFAAAIAI